jgi:hypothetical protein
MFFVNKKIQLDATVCRHLFTAQSLYMFRGSQHPSSGVLKTVTATSGVGHNIGTATSFQRGLIRPRWKEVAVPLLWPIPEVAVTVFSTPDDGCCDIRNMQSDIAVNKCLHIVASIWTFLLTVTRILYSGFILSVREADHWILNTAELRINGDTSILPLYLRAI